MGVRFESEILWSSLHIEFQIPQHPCSGNLYLEFKVKQGVAVSRKTQQQFAF